MTTTAFRTATPSAPETLTRDDVRALLSTLLR